MSSERSASPLITEQINQERRNDANSAEIIDQVFARIVQTNELTIESLLSCCREEHGPLAQAAIQRLRNMLESAQANQADEELPSSSQEESLESQQEPTVDQWLENVEASVPEERLGLNSESTYDDSAVVWEEPRIAYSQVLKSRSSAPEVTAAQTEMPVKSTMENKPNRQAQPSSSPTTIYRVPEHDFAGPKQLVLKKRPVRHTFPVKKINQATAIPDMLQEPEKATSEKAASSVKVPKDMVDKSARKEKHKPRYEPAAISENSIVAEPIISRKRKEKKSFPVSKPPKITKPLQAQAKSNEQKVSPPEKVVSEVVKPTKPAQTQPVRIEQNSSASEKVTGARAKPIAKEVKRVIMVRNKETKELYVDWRMVVLLVIVGFWVVGGMLQPLLG